jgi:arsenical pump membrane protein
LVALVTAVLNLDTAVVFLTPLLLHAARSAGLDERPFLYGTVLMSNSASLLLPGSNLTNLMVLSGTRVQGGAFALRMLGPWIVAVAVTGLVVAWTHRRALRRPAVPNGERVALRGRLGLAAAGLAAVLVVALPDPALPVLALGLGVAAGRARGRGAELRSAGRALGGSRLAALLAAVVLVGAAARAWSAPWGLTAGIGAWRSACTGALAAVLLNNLPAAALLSAHPPAHPLFILLGLDLGPNLGVSGSLSAVLWLQVARRAGARPSPRTYSTLGAAVVLLAVPLSVICLAATSGR